MNLIKYPQTYQEGPDSSEHKLNDPSDIGQFVRIASEVQLV